jgi:hypothetical protein
MAEMEAVAERAPVRAEAPLTVAEPDAAAPSPFGQWLNESPAAHSLAQMRRALDVSPRVQAQTALQRVLNANPPHGRGVFQRVRLNLRGNGTISGISNWPRRPTSNVSGSQGQHLTAYVSFTDMILSNVRDKTVEEAADELIDILDRMQEFPGGDHWYRQYGTAIETNKALLQQAANDDDAATVGSVINNILSLRNKMPDTAIATREQTWGHGESRTSGSLEVLETILRQNAGALPNTYDEDTEAEAALYNMWRLLDYQPTGNASDQAFQRTENRVLRHVMQMRLSYPAVFGWLTARGSWLMPYLEENRDDAGMPLTDLTDVEMDDVTEYVHENL